MPKFRVLTGINYPGDDGEKRAEPGDIVDDLPDKSAKWLERDGIITADLEPEQKKRSSRKPEPEEVS